MKCKKKSCSRHHPLNWTRADWQMDVMRCTEERKRRYPSQSTVLSWSWHELYSGSNCFFGIHNSISFNEIWFSIQHKKFKSTKDYMGNELPGQTDQGIQPLPLRFVMYSPFPLVSSSSSPLSSNINFKWTSVIRESWGSQKGVLLLPPCYISL